VPGLTPVDAAVGYPVGAERVVVVVGGGLLVVVGGRVVVVVGGVVAVVGRVVVARRIVEVDVVEAPNRTSSPQSDWHAVSASAVKATPTRVERAIVVLGPGVARPLSRRYDPFPSSTVPPRFVCPPAPVEPTIVSGVPVLAAGSA
jgi:hypothetical protein